MAEPPSLNSLCVVPGVIFVVGQEDVTSIRWSEADGPMGRYATVQVYKKGDDQFPYAVFPFHQCVGVYHREKNDG